MGLAKKTAALATGQAISKGGFALASVALAWVLPKEEFAAFALLLLVYSLALTLGSLNLHHGIYFFWQRAKPVDRRGELATTAALQFLAAAIVGVLLLVLAPHLTVSGQTLAPHIPMLALALVFELPSAGGPQMLIAADRVGLAAVLDACSGLGQLAAFTVPALLGAGLGTTTTCLFVYAALRACVVFALAVVVSPPGRFRVSLDRVKAHLVYGLPLALALAASAINRQLDRIVVRAFDEEHFAEYALAAHEVPLVPLIPYAAGAVIATRLVAVLARGELAVATELWMAQTARMALIVLPMTVAVFLCAPELVELVLRSDYAAASVPFQIYTLILLHRVAEYGLILRAGGRTAALWRASAVLLVSNVVFSVPLAMAFGMNGAALGTLIANALAWIYILVEVAAMLGTTVRASFPWRTYVLTLTGAGLAAAASGLVALNLETHAALILVTKLVVAGFLFGIFVQLSGVLRSLPRLSAEEASAPAPS